MISHIHGNSLIISNTSSITNINLSYCIMIPALDVWSDEPLIIEGKVLIKQSTGEEYDIVQYKKFNNINIAEFIKHAIDLFIISNYIKDIEDITIEISEVKFKENDVEKSMDFKSFFKEYINKI